MNFEEDLTRTTNLLAAKRNIAICNSELERIRPLLEENDEEDGEGKNDDEIYACLDKAVNA